MGSKHILPFLYEGISNLKNFKPTLTLLLTSPTSPLAVLPKAPKTAATVAAFPLLMPAKLYHTPGHLCLLPHTLQHGSLLSSLCLMHKDTPRPETAVVETLFQSSYHFLKPYFIFIYLNIYYIPY